MARQLRAAICQLQSHPLVIVGDRNISAEPFFPEKGVSLADLARHSLDVSRLQERFFARYLDWQSQRILAITRYLEQMTPVPDIVVFPEGAVPLESLYELRDFAEAKAVTVFAGTHSFRVTSTDFAHYKALGVRNSELKGWEKGRAGTAILPIVTPTGCTFRLKHHSSVFEVTGIATHVPSLDPVDVVSITARGNRYDILPLVCADALHMPNTRGAYSVVVIVAYNRVIDPFLPLIEQNTFNRIPVLLCNDGQFGGSCVAVRQDDRMDTWWWSSPRSGRLSPGDALLVVDIDMDSLAPQVSVANPHAAAQLVSISDVVATAGVSPAFAVSQRLADIRSNTDNFVQADLLDQCISQLSPSQIQRDKIQQLRRLALQGTADSSWWDALASTCTFDGLPDLGILESDFAKECVESLDPLVSQATVSDDTALGKLVRFLKRCRDRCHPATDPTSPATTLEISVHALIDREYETKTIRQFLDSRNEAVLIVTGLDSVGKTTVFDATLAQAGRVRTVTVTLVDDSSPDFIAEALARSLRLPRSSSTDVATVERITDAAFPDSLPQGAIVVLENVHCLLDHNHWRDPRTPTLLKALASATVKRSGKLIIEANCRIDLDDVDVARTRRLWIKGLEAEHAGVFLDQQLRRAGLDPSYYDGGTRTQIATDLGGHPGAIILVTEYIGQLGIDTVKTELHARTGVHSRIVRQILSQLEFSEDEQTIVSLLSQARIPLPSQILNDVLFKNCLHTVNELIRKSVVERCPHDYVALASLVAGFSDFAPLSPETTLRFHFVLAEAFARLSAAGDTSEHLRWAVESRYHAYLAGNPQVAPSIEALVDGVLGAASDLVKQKKYELARPVVDELIRSHRTGETCELAACVYARLGLVDEALVLAKEAVSLDSHRGWALTEVGRLALYVHRDEISADALDVARRIGHDTTFVAVLDGKIQLKRGDLDAAIQAFGRGVDLSDTEPRMRDGWPHFYMGRTLIKANRIDEAVDVLFRGETAETDRYRTRRDVLVAIRTQLALAYILSNDLVNAERVLNLILKDDARSPEVARVAAYFRAAKGTQGVAHKALSELDPSRARDRFARCQVHLFRALFYLQLGQPENSSREFAAAHQEDPRNVFVLLKWASTLVEMATESTSTGDVEIARMCAEQAHTVAGKVLEFDVDNTEALRILEKLADDFNVL